MQTAGCAAVLAALQERFGKFEALGLKRPAALSVREYLEALAAEGVLTGDAARTVALLYQHCRFGRADADADTAARAAAALDAALDALQSRGGEFRAELAQRLHGRSAPAKRSQANRRNVGEASPAAASPVLQSAIHSPQSAIRGETSSLAAMSPQARRAALRKRAAERGPSRLWTFVAGALVIWTLAVMAGSLWQRDRIFGLLVTSEWGRRTASRLRGENSDAYQLRRNLTLHKLDAPAGRFMDLAERYARRRRYAEAIHTYHQALCRARPGSYEESQLANDLAWLLLRAEDPWYRDPVQAMRLARMAIQTQPHRPEYLDTMAEAHFQMGDVAAALRLENEALDRIGPASVASQHYREQCLRFQSALAATQPADDF